MLLLQCKGCGTTATVDCTCPPELDDLPFHAGGCPLTDVDAQLACPTGSGCCTDDHGGVSHGTAAINCPADHTGQPCPEPATCGVWGGMVRDVAALDPANPQHMAVKAELEAMYGRPVEGDCPGGHHAKGVDGCAVCRPITITLIGGTRMRRAM